jgi:hypothetical protein
MFFVYFIIMFAICAAIAMIISWMTGQNFWILTGILVGAVLVNGLIASIEDGDVSEKQKSSDQTEI